MPLAEYRRKRDFRRTPEPRGKRARRSAQLSFVVQKHAASHGRHAARGSQWDWAGGLFGARGVVLLRHQDKLLTMSMLRFTSQLKSSESFAAEVPEVSIGAQELRLARTLVREIATDKFDWSKYHDDYTEKLTEVIEAKVERREVVAPPADHESPVINLMDALKKSVAEARHKGPRAGKAAASKRRSAAQ